MQKILQKLGVAVALTVSQISLAENITPTDPFPDTPANRQIEQQAYQTYTTIKEKHSRTIDVNGIQMAYLEWGTSGVPLIWAHGSGSTGYELINVAEPLVEAGFHVYAITYRGHGQTQVTDYDFSLKHIADDIIAMMDKLGIKKAVIGGLSLGGNVATAFYDEYPERALGLALEDGGAHAPEPRTLAFYDHKVSLRAGVKMAPFPVFKDRFEGFKFLNSVYMPGFPKDIWPVLQSWLLEQPDGSFKVHYDPSKLIGGTTPSVDPNVRSFQLQPLGQSYRRIAPLVTYRNLSVPMLIIDPTGDVFNPEAEFRKLRNMHPDLITWVKYPDTPHAAHPIRPDWFVRDMKELLLRIQSN